MEDNEAYKIMVEQPCFTAYHPFYENCIYELVLEVNTDEAGLGSLMEKLGKDVPEHAIYKKCRIPHSVA